MSEDLRSAIVRFPGARSATAGTGFLVGGDGLVVRCAHVIDNSRVSDGGSVDLSFYANGKRAKASIETKWWRDRNAEDIAVLRLNEPTPDGAHSLRLGSSNHLADRSFRTFGFPSTKATDGMPGRGTVVGETVENGYPLLTVSSEEISLGFSGAPAVDAEMGLVIGIVVSISKPDERGRYHQTAFLIPSRTLAAVCEALPVMADPDLESLAKAIRRSSARLPYFFPGILEASRALDDVFVPVLVSTAEPGVFSTPEPRSVVEALRESLDGPSGHLLLVHRSRQKIHPSLAAQAMVARFQPYPGADRVNLLNASVH